MTTQTLIDIIQNRIKNSQQNPTEAQFLVEIDRALERLKEYEEEDKREQR